MWQAVLLSAYLTIAVTSGLDSSIEHDINLATYLSTRQWTPVGLQVMDVSYYKDNQS